MYSSSPGCHTATGTRTPHGTTQCYVLPGRADIHALTPAEVAVLDLATVEGCKAECDVECVGGGRVRVGGVSDTGAMTWSRALTRIVYSCCAGLTSPWSARTCLSVCLFTGHTLTAAWFSMVTWPRPHSHVTRSDHAHAVVSLTSPWSTRTCLSVCLQETHWPPPGSQWWRNHAHTVTWPRSDHAHAVCHSPSRDHAHPSRDPQLPRPHSPRCLSLTVAWPRPSVTWPAMTTPTPWSRWPVHELLDLRASALRLVAAARHGDSQEGSTDHSVTAGQHRVTWLIVWAVTVSWRGRGHRRSRDRRVGVVLWRCGRGHWESRDRRVGVVLWRCGRGHWWPAVCRHRPWRLIVASCWTCCCLSLSDRSTITSLLGWIPAEFSAAQTACNVWLISG